MSPAQTAAVPHAPWSNAATGRADGAETLRMWALTPIFKSLAANSEKREPLHQCELNSREQRVTPLARVNLAQKPLAEFTGSPPAPACPHQQLQLRSQEGSGTPDPQCGEGARHLLALISVVSVRGWKDARKSKILHISQKGKKKAGVQLPAQA